MHAFVKELAIRRVEHRSEIHSNESQHQAEGTEEARLRRRFSFVLQQQTLSFCTRHHLCRQGVTLVSTRQLRLQGLVSVHSHRTEGVTGSEGRKAASGVGGRIRAGDGNGDGNGVGGENGDVNGHGDGDGAGAGTGVEANEGEEDENGDGSEDGAGTGTGAETRRQTQDGNGTGAETGRERGRGWRPVDEHRMGTGTGTGTKTRTVEEMGTGTRIGTGTGRGGNGDGDRDPWTNTG